MTVMTWTDDRVEQLKKLWEAGLSASQIAAELGNVTRNAVIGKVHRLGLSGRAKSPSSAAPRQRKARPAQQMVRVARPVSRGNTALAHAFEVEVEPDPIAFDNVVPMSQRLSLLELNEATCHWPVGDPVERRLLLLRRQGAGRPALLRAPLAHRLSAGLPTAAAGAEADAVKPSRSPLSAEKCCSSSRRAGTISTVIVVMRSARSPTHAPTGAIAVYGVPTLQSRRRARAG